MSTVVVQSEDNDRIIIKETDKTIRVEGVTETVRVVGPPASRSSAIVRNGTPGQLLMSNGELFLAVEPMTSAADGWLVNAQGDLLVGGTI